MNDKLAEILAARIADGLGWKDNEHRCETSVVYRCDPDIHNRGNVWCIFDPDVIDISAPGDPLSSFRLSIYLEPAPIRAMPYFGDRHRWNDTGREFVRRVDGMCDGLITYGLRNANETACLDWLTGKTP